MAFLLSYRTTPHSTTGVSPAQLFLGRSVRTRLDLLRPSVSDQVSCSQAKQKKYHDVHVRSRDFFVGQRVYARNYRGGSKWVPGTLVARRGPLSFVVQVNDGVQWHRHVDQLVESPDSPQDCSSSSVLDVPDHDLVVPSQSVEFPSVPLATSVQPTVSTTESTVVDTSTSSSDSQPASVESPSTPPRRYPRRSNRRPPLRYTDTSSLPFVSF